ncbi:MAG: Ig-like domain-containing protein, partial [Candidatus Acidiferrales bacterium]
KLSIAEPFGLGAGKVMFVLKVASLQNAPPSTTWPIQFQANGQEFIARMHTNALGQIGFTVASGTNASPLTNPGVPADATSGFSVDGTIRIVVSRSVIGGAAPGQQLTQFLVRVRSPEGGVTALTPDNMPDSLARTGAYTLRGSENCGNPPEAVDDSATAKKNHPVLINVVANDTVHHPPLVVTQVSDPSNGVAVNNGDGTVTYRPNRTFTGPDSFQYTACDANNQCDSATVSVTVKQGNKGGS